MFVVGRETEVAYFSQLISAETPQRILNVYGPGGIGKTIVGERMRSVADTQQHPLVFIDGIDAGMTPLTILDEIRWQLHNEATEAVWREFGRKFDTHTQIYTLINLSGGIEQLYAHGKLRDPATFHQLAASLGAIENATLDLFSNQFRLNRHLRRAEQTLLTTCADALQHLKQKYQRSPTLLFDTYEEMEALDDWMCRRLLPALSNTCTAIVLGRNDLMRINFEWGEWASQLQRHELDELSETEAKAYLRHYGLSDPIALNEIVRFTGGYPLLLVLVRHLAQEVGGWQRIGALEHEADRDQVTTKLLTRILREEQVRPVRRFLERGAIAQWFTPEIICLILDVDEEAGRNVYDALSRHSFVQRHPNGLKFHDKIRELLAARFRFAHGFAHDQLKEKLENYLAEKANVAIKPVAPSIVKGDAKPTLTFGQLLRFHRNQTTHPTTGAALTQQQVLNLLSELGHVYSGSMLSYWEQGKRTLGLDLREVLVALIQIYFAHGGIQTIDEANQLLHKAGHRRLGTQEEQFVQHG